MLGKPVPDFSLASTGATTFRLSSARGKTLALYLCPPERHQDFRRARCEVFAASRDSVKSHENFKSKTGTGRKSAALQTSRRY